MARILIIEDNPANLELMSYLLGAYGHEVESAMDGRAGLAAARRGGHDLVLCDLHLPQLDGWAIARALRPPGEADTAGFPTPLVAVTALAMVGDDERARQAGFDGYLAKPIDPQRFVDQVEAFLPTRALSGEPLRPSQFSELSDLADPVQAQAPRGRILVVDDEPTNREMTHAILAPFGYELVLTGGVDEAWEAGLAGGFDLILSDLHMPGQDGWDLLKRVAHHPRLANVPCLVISSTQGDWADPERARSLGACGFLVRPIDPRVLLAEVGARVGKPVPPA